MKLYLAHRAHRDITNMSSNFALEPVFRPAVYGQPPVIRESGSALVTLERPTSCATILCHVAPGLVDGILLRIEIELHQLLPFSWVLPSKAPPRLQIDLRIWHAHELIWHGVLEDTQIVHNELNPRQVTAVLRPGLQRRVQCIKLCSR